MITTKHILKSLEVGDFCTFQKETVSLLRPKPRLKDPIHGVLLHKGRTKLFYAHLWQRYDDISFTVEEIEIGEIVKFTKGEPVPLRIFSKRVTYRARFALMYEGKLHISDGDPSYKMPPQKLFELLAEGLGYDLE